MSSRFDGKVALVTGAASGIGKATAALLVARGASVVIADLDESAAVAVAAELGGGHAVGCDVADEGAVEAAVATAVERFGGLDVMVNNAGIIEAGPLVEMASANFTRILTVNAVGVFHGIKHAAPAIAQRGGGAIVSTSSSSAVRGAPMLAAYGCSKAAVTNLTQSAALELRAQNIRVNCVQPGMIVTGMMDQMKADFEQLWPDSTDDLITLKQGRPGAPEDVARAIVYLASDTADFITGVALAVDNGLILV